MYILSFPTIFLAFPILGFLVHSLYGKELDLAFQYDPPL